MSHKGNMIILHTKIVNHFCQADYTDLLMSIDLSKLICPHCKKKGMVVFAYYLRKCISCFGSGRTEFKVLRVRCRNTDCLKTHALLPSCLIPYEKVMSKDVIRICASDDNEEILSDNPNLFAYDIASIRKRYAGFIEKILKDDTFFKIAMEDRVLKLIGFVLSSRKNAFITEIPLGFA